MGLENRHAGRRLQPGNSSGGIATVHGFIGEAVASAFLQDVAALHHEEAGPPAPPPAPGPGSPRANTAPDRPNKPNGSPSSSSSSNSSSSSAQSSEGGVVPDAPRREHEPDPDTRFRYRASLANLDPFIAEDVLARPCCVFRAPPHFCKGVLRKALQVALELIRSCSRTANGADGIHLVRAWKLWLFLPRMLLHRPAGGARVGKPALLVRFQSFMQGDWALLLRDALLRPAPSSPWRAVGSATGAHRCTPGPRHRRNLKPACRSDPPTARTI